MISIKKKEGYGHILFDPSTRIFEYMHTSENVMLRTDFVEIISVY